MNRPPNASTGPPTNDPSAGRVVQKPTQAPALFAPLLAWVVGTGLQLQQATLWDSRAYLAWAIAAVGLGLGLILLVRRSPAMSFWQLAGFALAAGALAFSTTGMRAAHFLSDSLKPALQGRDLVVTGLVTSMVQRNEAGLRFRLGVESAKDGQTEVQLPSQIYLSWYGGVSRAAFSAPSRDVMGEGQSEPGSAELLRQPLDLTPGDRWQMTVRLKAPHGASNPHGFDFELWLWEQGLSATGYVRSTPKDAPPQRLAQGWTYPVERLRQSTRDAILERVPDRKLAGVIAALVVGDQNAIDRADWDVFRATGVAHLMSISGLHITMFAWGAALLVGWLWRRSGRLCQWLPASIAGVLGGASLATAYAIFSGWGLPAQRTIVMLVAFGGLKLLGKRWPWPHTWMLACAVVVLFDPWALLQAGFWLSFVAVGVLFASDPGAAKPDSPSWLQRLLSTLREQWTITLALTPLTLLLFGQVSVVGLVANLVAIPWVTLVVTPLAMLGSFFAPLWDVAALAVQILAGFLNFAAGLRFATVSVAQAPFALGVAALLGGLLLVLRLPWYGCLAGLPLLLPVLLWQAPRPDLGHFELLAADIGQGNAVVVRTSQHALVFDTGPRFSRESDAGNRVLVPLLRSMDERIDTLVLSHRDSDHTGGAMAVLAMQPQAQLLSSIEETHELQKIRPATRCIAGQKWRWDAVDFEILQPFEADYAAPVSSNAMSCVLRISNGQRTALLAGDIELAQETRLVERGAKLKADVLLVPHHGSKTSSSGVFLDAVAPDIALVQAGFRNRFGHPAASVLERYDERHIRVVDTVHCGAATWNSANAKSVECQRAKALRYWHQEH